MYRSTIKTFYREEMVVRRGMKSSRSKSPLKPALLMKHLDRVGFSQHLDIQSDFPPLLPHDIIIAHTSDYYEAFFQGTKPLATSNWLPWSKDLVQAVHYTTSSLYNAIRASILAPDQICFSPTSGFHHAKPTQGAGFCTFSGQVISSVKVYRELGKTGAYLDLDGHHGNSIDDTRLFCPDLDKAVPPGFNINPIGWGEDAIHQQRQDLRRLEKAILANEIHYVVWCHGADSHKWDDMGGDFTTEQWLQCAKMFYLWVKQVSIKLGRPLPVVLTLFGGYRKDDYNSVLDLHTADLVECLNALCGHSIQFTPTIKKPRYADRSIEG